MTVRDALNSALDEEMSADPKVFLMGEEVRENEQEPICICILYDFCMLMVNFKHSDAGWRISGCL